ncbi:MAG: squalene synthase HpnC [Betaproteobacteria bacterium]
MPVDHYENFPVASILLPPRVRRPIESIYAFARSADDFADEGSFSNSERIERLSNYDRELANIAAGIGTDHPLFVELGRNIRTFDLPIQLLHDLLDAFKQDVIKTRYENYAELVDYCRRSANPIGRLLLHLFDIREQRLLEMSDQICTALQLINHWQDIAIDWKKNATGRVYLPQDEMHQFGVSDHHIATEAAGGAWQSLMTFQVNRARQLMLSGAPLAHTIKGRFGIELQLIVAGGLTILDKIEAANFDVFRQRPTLSRLDWLMIICRVIPAAIIRR